jgi:hypothetical protein
MFSSMFGKKAAQEKKNADFEIEEADEEQDSAFMKSLQVNLTRLIAYAECADAKLQREVSKWMSIKRIE